jgi:hypothetical protein
MLYAKTTRVPVDRSQQEIDRLLRLYGAAPVTPKLPTGMIGVAFEMGGRRMCVAMPEPNVRDVRIALTPKRMLVRGMAERRRLLERDTCRIWRTITLLVRARLEALENQADEYADAGTVNPTLALQRRVTELTQAQLDRSARRVLGQMPRTTRSKGH